MLEGLLAFRTLKAAGCGVWSLLEPFDPTTPMGEYMFVQSLNNAQLWKKTFLQRARLGMVRTAQAGQWLGGSAPLGYRVEGKRGARRLVIDEETPLPGGFTPAGLVRWLFERIGQPGSSCAALAADLNGQGVPPPYALTGRQSVGRTGKARVWFATTVHTILTSTTYKGVQRYGKKGGSAVVEAPCPALVSVEVWEAAQAALKRNYIGAGRNTRRHYLLRGLIRCGTCGASMCGTTHNPAAAQRSEGREGVSYYCIRAYQHRLLASERCDSAAAPGALEWIVWDEIAGFLTSPVERARLSAAIRQQADQPPPEDDTLRLQSALAGKAAERDSILTLFRAGRIPSEALERQLVQIDQEEAHLRAALAQAQEAAQRLQGRAQAAERAMDAVEALALAWGPQIAAGEAPPFEDRRRLVLDLVESITVHTIWEGDKKVPDIHIRYRFEYRGGGATPGASEGSPLSIAYDTVHRIGRNRK